MKKLFGFVAAAVLAVTSGFALDMGLGGKLDIGYATGAAYVDVGDGISGYADMSGFELYPALVIAPDKTAFEGKPFDVTFEASLDMIFGSSDYYDGYKVTVITPGISVLYNYHFENSDSEFLQKLTPYAGVNIGVPIQKSTFSVTTVEPEYKYDEYLDKNVPTGKSKNVDKDYSGTKIDLGMGFVAGASYAITEKIDANVEMGYNFLSLHDFFIRGGAMYRFK